jgi:hypothetical protein
MVLVQAILLHGTVANGLCCLLDGVIWQVLQQ